MTAGKHTWFPHDMPLPIGHMLSPPTGKAQTAFPQQRVQPDSYFPTGIKLTRIWMEFTIIKLPNPFKSVRQGEICPIAIKTITSTIQG